MRTRATSAQKPQSRVNNPAMIPRVAALMQLWVNDLSETLVTVRQRFAVVLFTLAGVPQHY